MKLRNLARNTLFMAYFNAITVAAVYASWRLLQGGPLLGWLGVLLTTAPLVAYVSYALLTLRVARTSERLPPGGCRALGRVRAGESCGARQGADEAWDEPHNESATPNRPANLPGPPGWACKGADPSLQMLAGH